MGKRHDMLMRTLDGIGTDETFSRLELRDRVLADNYDILAMNPIEVVRIKSEISHTIAIAIKYGFLEVVDYRDYKRGGYFGEQSPVLRKVVE